MFLQGLVLLSFVYVSTSTTSYSTSTSSCNKYKLNQNRCLENKDPETGEQCAYL